MSKSQRIIIVGASGYIGKILRNTANGDFVVYGTSSAGTDGLLTLRLDAPSDFDYGKIGAGDVVLLTAAISAPDICAREHDRAWAVNVTGTSEFISKVIAIVVRGLSFSPAIRSTVNAGNTFDESRRMQPSQVNMPR